MNNGNGAIETTDLGMASYLYSIGGELISVDRANPRRAIFAFELSPDQKERIGEWQSGNATGNLLGFWTSYQQVKIALHKSH